MEIYCMSKKNSIDAFAESGLQFHGIDYVAEIFPAPIPEEINDIQIESEADLFRMSNHEGYEELYIPSSKTVSADSNGKTCEFDRNDFLAWQLSRMSAKTLYQLISKTSADVTEIFDADEEYEKDPDYYPEGWLNPYETEEGNYEKGIELIERFKKESPKKFYKAMTEAILDSDFGILAYLETEIDGNLEEVRSLYSHWDVPLMIVSKGKFHPYIEDSNLMMDDYKLDCMYVRNQDEGEI